MVWFPSITTAPTTATSTPPTSPLPPTAPTRQSRERCWAVRDAFFDCLNTHGIIDSLKDKDLAAKNCRQEDIDFGRECVGSWVEYFKKRRVMEYKKEQMLKGLEKEGAVKLETPVGTQRPKE